MLAQSPGKQLPDSVVNRLKTGFSVPMASWLAEPTNPRARADLPLLAAPETPYSPLIDWDNHDSISSRTLVDGMFIECYGFYTRGHFLPSAPVDHKFLSLMSKILIHALGANMGGALRHLTNFMPELGRHDTNREYVVLVRESFPPLQVAENIRIERVPDQACSSRIRRIAKDVFELPRRLKREKFSAIVSLTNFGPIWSPVPHILFQRNSVYYCPYFLQRIGGQLKLETALRRRLAVESMKHAKLIVTPSRAMGKMIREACPEIRDRPFHTLYHGFTKDALTEPLDEKFVRLLAAKKGARLLYPTHPAHHKGFEVLFEILNKLKLHGLDFCLFTTISVDDWPEGVGDYERRVRELGLENNVVFMGTVPQRQMGSLYKSCDLMVYPSLCESFGFSMLEAMGYGLPLVAADTAINREMSGAGALYYPPLSAMEGAKAISDALDPAVMERLREAGRAHLASFDWGWRRYASEFVVMLGLVV